MEYLSGLPQDTKSLRSCSGKQSEYESQKSFGIKCHSQYNKVIIIIIIIIIIKRGWQCKAGRERLTPYQSEDPNPTTPTH